VTGYALTDDAPRLITTCRSLERTLFHAGEALTTLGNPTLHLTTDTSVSRAALSTAIKHISRSQSCHGRCSRVGQVGNGPPKISTKSWFYQ